MDESLLLVGKVATTVSVLLFFAVLFALFAAADRRASHKSLVRAGVGGMSIVGLLPCFWMLTYTELGLRPILIFSLVLGLNLVMTGLVLLHNKFETFYWAGNGLTFLLLLSWTLRSMTEDLLITALVFFLAFGAIHALFSLLSARGDPRAADVVGGRFSGVDVAGTPDFTDRDGRRHAAGGLAFHPVS